MSVAIDLGAAIDRATESAERRAELDKRDTEYGGMRSLPIEIAEDERKRSTHDWRAYKPEVKWAEIRAAAHGEPVRDPRRVSPARMARDIRISVARFTKLRRDERELLANDALALILSWPSHGESPRRIDLGGLHAERSARIRARREPTAARATLRYLAELERLRELGSLPLRRDWIDPSKRDRDGAPMNTPLAVRALRAAVKQAHETRYWRAERYRGASEEPSGLDLTAELDAEEESDAERLRVPSLAAAEVIAELLSIPLDGARAIIAQHERVAHETGALRTQWGLSPSAYTTSISRGAAIVRERFPEPATLLAELESLPERYRDLAERGAILALSDFKRGWCERETASAAVVEYRAAIGTMPERDRAPLAAARRALSREALRSLSSPRSERDRAILAAARRALSRARAERDKAAIVAAALGALVGRSAPSAEQVIRARATYGSERAERIALSASRLVPAEIRRAKRGGIIRSELAESYPEPSAPRAKLTLAARRAMATASSELVHELDSRSPRAEKVAALRSLLRAIERGERVNYAQALRRALDGSERYESYTTEPSAPSESPSPQALLSQLREESGNAPLAERAEQSDTYRDALRRALRPIPSAALSGETPPEPELTGWATLESNGPSRYWGSPNHPVGRASYPSA